MNKFSQDDENLVSFLQQNRPKPPEISDRLEKQMFELVERENILDKPRSHRPFWTISSAIAAGVFMTWGSYRLLNPQPQTTVNTQELEIFLVNSWNDSLGDRSTVSLDYQENADLLDELDRPVPILSSRR